MFDFLLTSIAILGAFSLGLAVSYRFLFPSISKIFPNNKTSFPTQVLVIGIGWYLGLAFRGIISSWAFYLGVSVSTSLLVNVGFGMLGLLLLFLSKKHLHPITAIGKDREKLNALEAGIVAVIVLFVFLYAFRAIAPWRDHDEMAVYSVVTKYIAHGGTFPELVKPWSNDPPGARMVEASDAVLYRLVSGPLLVKAYRILNVLISSGMLYGFIYCLTPVRVWAMVGAALFLGTPEFYPLATSLKVDAIVMGLELSSLMLLCITLISFLPEYRNRLKSRSALSLAAVALALASFAARQSGMNLSALATLVVLFVLWTELRSKWIFACCFGALVLAWLVVPTTPLFNYIYYGNPLHPFQGPWPFHKGHFSAIFRQYQERYNLPLPPLVTQLYLPLHLALGLEMRAGMPALSFLPHAAHRQIGMVWLTPALLSVYIVPFFLRAHSALKVFFPTFLWFFCAWSFTIHYSRVFIAGSTLSIVMAVLMASSQSSKLKKWQRFLQKSLQVGLGISIAVLVHYQVKVQFLYFHNFKALYDDSARYISSLKVFDFEYGYRNFPSLKDIEAIDKILETAPNTRVLVVSETGRIVHVFFRNGFFVDAIRGPAYYLIKPEIQKSLPSQWQCGLLEAKSYQALRADLRQEVERKLPIMRYKSQNGNWEFRCRTN